MGMNTDKPNPQSMALDATVLANERTFQSWIRTGLAALASGLGVAKFFSESMPLWMLLTIATVLIALSIGAFMLASWRYNALHFKMQDLDVEATPRWVVRMISFSLVGCAFLALGGIMVAALG
jgi:putative membrane protein